MIAMGETKTKSDKLREKISNLKIVLHIKYVVSQVRNNELTQLILYHFLSRSKIFSKLLNNNILLKRTGKNNFVIKLFDKYQFQFEPKIIIISNLWIQ